MCSICFENAFPVSCRCCILAALVLAGGVFVSCRSDLTANKPELIELTGNGEIELVKVDSIKLDPGDQMIGRFHEYMKINDEGTVLLFTDLLNQQLFLFDRQGKLLNTIGGEGSGPEEFLQIISFDVDKDRVVVADESLYIVKVFSLGGELLNSFRLFDNENLVISSFDTHVDDHWLYLQIIESKYTNEKSKSAIAVKIDLNTGQEVGLIGTYDPNVTISNYYHNVHRFAIDEQNQRMVTSLNMSSGIQIFDLRSNTRTKYFVAETPEWKPLKEKVDAMMSRQQISELTRGASQIHSIFVNDRFIFQVFQTQTEEFQQTSDPITKEHVIALYDTNGEIFYGTVDLPGLPGAVHNDQLFIIENVNPDQYTIGVYEIVLDQNADHSAMPAGSLQ